ncbi:NAD(P)-dependent alcohol dehydrogenase [Saccharopolyspora rosea]|uniref:alcohol dehydrogenase n=1 Tax=Saccharopolyspora rosea TaxID=524884 RepID=A0ABW3FY25_9PSEU|nr:NAD(P)-dependent alcohol dehydrogenase [Saccharopolyspora rosea]
MGSVMKAVRYPEVGARPEVVEVPVPDPGPGQVLLKVTAAGMCHSDIAVMSRPAPRFPFPLPMTLGHEAVGTVAALGAGVHGMPVGEPVAVYGPWGCGVCRKCAQGKENYCTRADDLGIRPPGLGADGAMAEYMLVDDTRHLVPLHGLDPVQAAPLTDAGLTPYHALKRSMPKLVGGSTAVVIGVGGLGHIAVQLLRATTPARVIALDVADEKLELAAQLGAHDVVRSDDAPDRGGRGGAARRIRRLTGGDGADVVLDFVGAESTAKLAVDCVAVEGDITIVGIVGAPLPVGFGLTPHEVAVAAPYWGTRAELIEVLDLARAGAVRAHVETYGIDETPEVYERLHHGQIRGRAVIVP